MKQEKGMLGVLCTLVLMILLLIPLQAAQASVKPSFNEGKGSELSSSFQKGLNNRAKTSEKDDSFGSSIIQKIEGMYAPTFKTGVNIFSILFVLGVIVMVMALITKNGQWMKWATGSMIFSFVSMMSLRLGVYFLFSSDVVSFMNIFTDFLDLFKATALIFTPFMLIAGIRLRRIHESTKQPEYYRWSNRVITGSCFLCMLAVLAPWLFANM
ncbi:hypothetical protein F8161_19740 [Bacillus cereus]|uniref:Double stranded beta helix domain-containing protein n=2 Tax=Bacillus cereus group TaxID=86661 RepID=A0A9W7PZZ5_BACCE|nr:MULTISPECIES: hypothetical protein [Bacillus cereus group]KAA6449287.1 hypothetical protein DX932_29745 [Bacillus cereus]KAB2425302.1 hypothetical protein F8167_01445 [Bacillus cereus]KAB2439702.1 hypothetical protein F8163_27080 [Bacillus luti]KAB2458656.1 hypothetical protein F8161_19740 [Bacillus cereus]KAB2482962.1 hypothetical protein F8159_06485 [Bacillus cereus]